MCVFVALLHASTRAQEDEDIGRPFDGECPEGCKCFANPDGPHGCKVAVRCEARVESFPRRYAAGVDCVNIHNPLLSRLTAEQKQQLFEALPDGLRVLDLSLSGLGARGGLPAAAFARFGHLRFLNLEFSRLTAMPKDAFHGPVARSLRTLWLTGNHWQPHEAGYKLRKVLGNSITELDGSLFKGCEALRVLLMHHNKISSIDDALLRDVRQLRVLKLLDNALDDLSADDAPLAQLVDNVGVERCAMGQASRGECLQLDIDGDSGDDLEDIWDQHGVGIASDEVLDKFMAEFHDGNRNEL